MEGNLELGRVFLYIIILKVTRTIFHTYSNVNMYKGPQFFYASSEVNPPLINCIIFCLFLGSLKKFIFKIGVCFSIMQCIF